MAEVAWLFECQPLDPVSGLTKDVCFAKGIPTEDCFPGRPSYALRLEQPFYHECGIFEDNTPGAASVSIGSANINNADGRFDYLLNYAWDGRAVTIKRGLSDQAYGSYTTEFRGTVIEATADQDNIVLTLRDNSYKLIKQLQPNKYAGSGGAEGTSDIRDERKPLLFGRARNCAPIWVDNVLLIAQINDGAIASVQDVYDRANKLTFYQNFTTYNALVAATVPPGSYATSLETGFIKLGAPSAGVVTVDAVGLYSTAANLPEMLKQILLNKGGMTTADLNVPSFTQASLDAPEDFEGLYFQNPEIQLDELLELISTSFNGFWYANRQGLITVGQFKFSTPVAVIQPQDIMSLGKSASPPPIHKVRVSYGKNPTPLGPSDFVIDRTTFSGFLDKKYHHVDVTGTPDWSGAGRLNVFLGDTDINELSQVNFQIRDNQTWITIDPLGNITVTDPGTSPAAAVIRANFGEYMFEETFTVVRDTAAPLNKIDMTATRDHFYIDDKGAPSPTTQTSVITATGTNTTAPITLVATDNLGQVVTLTGGNTLDIANISKSPMVIWVDVVATDSSGTPVKQGRRFLIHRGEAGQVVDEPDLVGRSARPILLDDETYKKERQFLKKWSILASTSLITYGLKDNALPGGVYLRVASTTPTPELVTNGTMATTANWTAGNGNTTVAVNSGRLRVSSTSGSLTSFAYQAISGLTIGATYIFSVQADDAQGNANFTISDDIAGTTHRYSNTTLTNFTTITGTFVATQTTHYIRLVNTILNANNYAEFDNVSLVLQISESLLVAWKDVPVPYDVNMYYEVEFFIRLNAGTYNQISLGLEALDADKVPIDITGGSNRSNAHWIAAVDVHPTASWVYYRGFVKGTAATGSNTATSMTAPGVMRTGTNFIRPIVKLNYNGSGAIDWGHAAIRKADDLDKFPDGTTFGKILKAQLSSSGAHLLTVGGTNALQVGDQRNLPPVKAMNLGFLYSGTVSATASPTGATINTSAGSFTIGNSTVSYGAKSVNVTKVNATDLWFLYLVDAGYAGTGTLVATRTNSTIYSNDNNVYMGQIQITYPGSGTTTPTGDPPSGSCVQEDSHVLTHRGEVRAKDVRAEDRLLVLNENLSGVEWVSCTSNYQTSEQGYRLVTESGIVLDLSETTPLTLKEGACYPPEYEGQELPVYSPSGGLRWEKAQCTPIGLITVSHISCDNRVYAASKYGEKFLLTHNLNSYPKP